DGIRDKLVTGVQTCALPILLPTLMLAIPYTVLVVFTFNILLLEFGAADFCGTTAAFATVTQVGPIVTVLVVAGAGATAMCADLRSEERRVGKEGRAGVGRCE